MPVRIAFPFPSGPPAPAQQVLQLEDCANVWWLRFAMDHWCTTLAVGTNTGRVLVFDPHAPQVPRNSSRCRPLLAVWASPYGLLSEAKM